MKCATCGAGLASVDVRCSFCQTVTEFGHYELLEQKRVLDEEAQRRRERAIHTVETESEKASNWTLKGIFTFGLMNFYHGVQALWVARKHGLLLPTRSKIALVAGAVHLSLDSGLVSFGLIKNTEYRTRVEHVVSALAAKGNNETLERDVACLLFEQKQQQSALGIVTQTVCDGSFEQRGADVLLKDVQIERFGSRTTVNVCLRRSNTWQVSAVGEDVACGTPTVLAASTPTQPPKKPVAPSKPTPEPRVATIDAPTPAAKRLTPVPPARPPNKDVITDGNKPPKKDAVKDEKKPKKKRETL
jgi:hypothetical protein